jgi:hypothetical protein
MKFEVGEEGIGEYGLRHGRKSRWDAGTGAMAGPAPSPEADTERWDERRMAVRSARRRAGSPAGAPKPRRAPKRLQCNRQSRWHRRNDSMDPYARVCFANA